MNKILPAIIISLVCMQACNKKEPKPLTREEINKQIDIITKRRIKEVEDRARQELEYRIKIEVKIKADSILQSKQQNLPQTATALQVHDSAKMQTK
jgi:hypothetical protein